MRMQQHPPLSSLQIIIMSSSVIATAVVLFSSCFLISADAGGGASSSDDGPRYNAIFNFGDSTTDTGNLCTSGRRRPAGAFTGFTHSPYGMTYFGKATCRCSDGRVVVDFLAQAFGLPFLPPSEAHGKDFRRGANMAVGGGTVLDYALRELIGYNYDKSINGAMSAQIRSFKRLLPSICGTRKSCKSYLAKSLFLFQLGENDYNVQLVNGSTIDEASKSIPNIVRAITSGLEKLMALGAVDIVVSNIAPLGCFPMYLYILETPDKSDYDEYGCLRNYNDLYSKHNSVLQTSLSRLQKKHPRTRIMYADLGGHVYQMVQNPQKFGFETALASCCGNADAPYRFDLSSLCGTDGASACRDPSTYLSWDGIHMTDAGSGWVAEAWLNGPYCHPPIVQ